MCAFGIFNKNFGSCHLLSKSLTFISFANITSSFNNFNKFFSFRIDFYVLNYFISITIMFAANTACLCALTIENLNIQEDQKVHIFFFSLF